MSYKIQYHDQFSWTYRILHSLLDSLLYSFQVRFHNKNISIALMQCSFFSDNCFMLLTFLRLLVVPAIVLIDLLQFEFPFTKLTSGDSAANPFKCFAVHLYEFLFCVLSNSKLIKILITLSSTICSEIMLPDKSSASLFNLFGNE